MMRPLSHISAIIFAAMLCLGAAAQNYPDYPEFPIKPNFANSLHYKIAQKPVKESILLDDMEGVGHWVSMDGASLKYDSTDKVSGDKSLRISSPTYDYSLMRNPANLNEHGSMESWRVIKDPGASLVFDEPQDWSAYNRISIWIKRHYTGTEQQHLVLRLNKEGEFIGTFAPRPRTTIQDIPDDEWFEFQWEIEHLRRDSVKHFDVFYTLFGTPGAKADSIVISIDRVQLQKVEAEKFEGWEVADGKFAYSHIGYLPKAAKAAVYGKAGSGEFQLLDRHNRVAYTGQAQSLVNGNGEFAILDFSDFTREGEYRIRYDGNMTRYFPIDPGVWTHPAYAAINFLFCQRVGKDVPGYHSANHHDMLGVHGRDTISLDTGWYDAGDLGQGYWRTARGVMGLTKLYRQVKDNPKWEPVARKAHEEVLVGLDYIMRNQFSDGYHVTFVHNKHYTDNIIGTLDDRIESAIFVPWENFQGVVTMNEFAEVFADIEPAIAHRADSLASVLYDQTISYGQPWEKATMDEASWGAAAAASMFRKTGNARFREEAEMLGDLVIRCQQQEYVYESPATGRVSGHFFVNTDRIYYQTPQHQSSGDHPLIAMRALCETFPDSPKWIDWYACAAINDECFQKRGSLKSAPFNYLPTCIARRDSIRNAYPNTIIGAAGEQFYDANVIPWEPMTLRTFPIYSRSHFRGSNNIQLASTWGLAETALLRRNAASVDLAYRQLEWLMGRNPFSQTIMCGVGYDWTTLYAISTNTAVGALSAGVDCQHGDAPFWPSSAYASMKETWSDATSRFIACVALLMEQPEVHDSGLQIVSRRINDKMVELTVSGVPGVHKLEVKAWNSVKARQEFTVNVVEGKPAVLKVPLRAVNRNSPLVAVVVPNGDLAARVEISEF